ncbi:MAG: hypothetical protein EOP06_10700 [Proteobacteria bacterium]|nr:MAG: hypothetical protein EOP06_10700 [Pseudomonadota bacterium]
MGVLKLKSKMVYSILALASLFLTHAAHAARVEPIICEETGTPINDSEASEAAEVVISKVTISFDQKRNPIALTFERIATPKTPALKLNMTSANAKLAKIVVPHKDDAWGIENHERIVARGADGTSIAVNLNDHKYAGVLMGSTLNLKKGALSISTSKLEHQVICLTPTEKAEYEAAINGAIN